VLSQWGDSRNRKNFSAKVMEVLSPLVILRVEQRASPAKN
jgi:hypothetical protein